MLPNFLIIGVQKAATTWLAQCLGEHPNVFMSDKKELFFFDNYFDKGLAWYEAHFDEWAGEAAIGEATPGYIFSLEAPGRIKAVLGDEAKLIVSLRHPVDRAYSAFGQYMRQGRVPAKTDFPTFFRQGDPLNMRRRGHYVADLKRYLTHFPRENLLVLIYEELKEDNRQAIGDCFAFLGVDPQFIPESLTVKANKGISQRIFHSQADALRRYVAAKVKLLPRGLEEPVSGVGRRAYRHLILERLPVQTRYEPPDPELRQELVRDFMPDIRQLEDLLDRDLSAWYAPSDP
jgi:hypothetical protein